MRTTFNVCVFSIVLTFLVSCDNDYAELKISDFSKKESVTLTPYKLWPYAMLNIKFEGYVNDTIMMKWGYEKPMSEIILTGRLDTLIQTDYYGEGPRTFMFDPYRVTDGNLIIKINL